MNAQPLPNALMRPPATAGPTRAPSWNTAELRLIAWRRFVGPATSCTNAWRAGLSNTVAVPESSAAARMCHAAMWCDSVSRPTMPVEMPNTVCVTMSTRRRLRRSATTPPSRPNATIGANCRATVSPTIAVDPVSVSMSQSCATRAAQPPVLVRIWDST